MTKRLAITAVAVVALLASGAVNASAKTFKGTVVHRSSHAQSFVVAAKSGRMTAVHARKGLKVGSIVKVDARRLRNGTYKLRKARVLGRSRRARLHGTVTYVNRRTGAFVVSSRGASVLVHRHKAVGARAADSTTPAVGDQVTVDANLDDNSGEVEEQDVQNEGQNTGAFELEGVVLAVDSAARTLSVSADDDDQSGGTLTVNVPASFDITKFTVGNEVELRVTKNADGTYTLAETSGDDGDSEQADDGSDDQAGDTKSEQPGSGDSSEQKSGSHSSDD
jgi:hypothetical protein